MSINSSRLLRRRFLTARSVHWMHIPPSRKLRRIRLWRLNRRSRGGVVYVDWIMALWWVNRNRGILPFASSASVYSMCLIFHARIFWCLCLGEWPLFNDLPLIDVWRPCIHQCTPLPGLSLHLLPGIGPQITVRKIITLKLAPLRPRHLCSQRDGDKPFPKMYPHYLCPIFPCRVSSWSLC